MGIQRQVLEVFRLLTSFQLRVVPVHLRRTDYRIQWANEGSRSFDLDNWTVDTASYKEITKNWTPTIDLFAHTPNAKCRRFYFYRAAAGSAGVDAFAFPWTNEIAWICPPVYLASEAVKRVEHTTMMAIVMLPAWKTARFWMTIFPDGEHAVESCIHARVFRPHVIRGQFCQNKLMQGSHTYQRDSQVSSAEINKKNHKTEQDREDTHNTSVTSDTLEQ